MRLFMSLGFGLSIAMLAAPALAGSTANYRTENGVKVYRAQPTAALNQNQLAFLAQQKRTAEIKAAQLAAAQATQARKTEQAYERGFEKGFDAAQKQAKRSSRRRTRRNRYNYGRRYVTAYRRPFHYGYR